MRNSTEPEYYTISATGVCHFKRGNPTELIALRDWLTERETFRRIKRLTFFRNFRQWKALRMWRNSHRHFVYEAARRSAQEELLTAAPGLRDALAWVRKQLFELSQHTLFDLDRTKGAEGEPGGLEGFLRAQQLHAAATQQKIRHYSERIWAAVEQVVEGKLAEVRTAALQADEGPEAGAALQRRIGSPHPKEPQLREAIAHKEGVRAFPLRFFWLIDVYARDALVEIYFNSFHALIEELEGLAGQAEPFVQREADAVRPVGCPEPLFRLELRYAPEPVLPAESFAVTSRPLSDFVAAAEEEGRGQLAAFDLLAHPFELPPVTAEDFGEQQRGYHDQPKPRHFTAHTLTNVAEVTCALAPAARRLHRARGRDLRELLRLPRRLPELRPQRPDAAVHGHRGGVGGGGGERARRARPRCSTRRNTSTRTSAWSSSGAPRQSCARRTRRRSAVWPSTTNSCRSIGSTSTSTASSRLAAGSPAPRRPSSPSSAWSSSTASSSRQRSRCRSTSGSSGCTASR